MPSLHIEGIPKPVTVDETFRRLSPEDQGRTVDEIRAAWNAQQRQQQPQADTSFLGAIQHGIGSEAAGFAATGRVLDGSPRELTDEEVFGTGRPQSPVYSPATPELVEAVRRIELRRAVGLLPRAVAENVPGLAGMTAAGMAGAAAGSVVPFIGTAAGGLAGAGAYAVARGLGQNVEESAANNGHAQPTTGDFVRGGLTTAASAALDAFGARGFGHVATSTAAGRLRAALAASGREGATEATQQVVEDVGTSAGTQRGLHVDPAEVVTAGLLGTGTRATLASPGIARAAAGSGLEAIAERATRRELGELTPEQAGSIERINRELERRTVDTSRDVPIQAHLRSLATSLDGETTRLLRRAREAEWVDAEQHGELTDLVTTARRQNQELAEGSTDDDGNATGLAQLDAMENLPPDFRQSLRAVLVDRNTLATALREGETSGTFRRIGGMVGRGAAIAAGAHGGGPLGAAAAALAAAPAAARIGGAIGGFVDRRVGARDPLIVRARQIARQELENAGAEDPGTVAGRAAHMDRLLTDQRLSERAALGLATDAEAVAKEAAQMARTRAAWAKRRVAAGLDVTDEELGGLTNRDRADLLQRMRFDIDKAAQGTAASEATDARGLERQAASDSAQRGRETDQAWQQNDVDRQGLAQRDAAFGRAEAEQEAAMAALAAQHPVVAKAVAKARRTTPPEPQERPLESIGEAPGAAAATGEETASTDSTTRPDEAPAPRPEGIYAGWEAGLLKFAAEHRGVVLGPRDVAAALGALVDRGEVSSEVAEVARKGDRIGRRTLELLTAEAIRGRFDPDRPFAHLVPNSGGGAAANGGDRPVRNVEQYRSAASSYQTTAQRIAERAHADGDHSLVELVESMAASTETDFPPAERVRDAEELIAASRDEDQKAKRQAALRPLLRRYLRGNAAD